MHKVKFIEKDELHYGIVVDFTRESYKLAEEGLYLIEDAIYPQQWCAMQHRLIDITSNPDEYEEYINGRREISQEKSNAIQGCKLGKLVKFSIAKGYAWYIITKVGRKQVTLEWRGFDLERYLEPTLMFGGKMDKKHCEELIFAEEKFPQLIGEKEHETK